MRAPADSHAQLAHFRRLLTVGHVPITEVEGEAAAPRELADLSTMADDDDDTPARGANGTTLGAPAFRGTLREVSLELAEAHLNLEVRLSRLEDLASDMIGDPWAGPAWQAMLARVVELVSLNEAVERVCADARDWRVAAMLAEDAPLADYTRGALAWADGVVRAFDDLAAGLLSSRPDFEQVRRRLEDAQGFHLEDLVAAIRADAHALGIDASSPEGRHLEELLWASSWLETTLTARLNTAA